MSHIACYRLLCTLEKRNNRSLTDSNMISLMAEQMLALWFIIIYQVVNQSNHWEQWKLKWNEYFSWVLLQNPLCGRLRPRMPDDPPEPRVQDTWLHITTCQLLSSWRRAECADTGPVWGAGPVSETEPGIWTPAVTRCTGHVSLDTWHGSEKTICE